MFRNAFFGWLFAGLIDSMTIGESADRLRYILGAAACQLGITSYRTITEVKQQH